MVICSYTVAAAKVDERDVLSEMTDGIQGLVIADKGYIRPSLRKKLPN